ncbi:MAG TPA: MFS transporter [Acidobacteriota bacterium]|jgi:MFS family permease
MIDQRRTVYALSILFAINLLNFFDRQILGAVTEPIRREWGLSDSAMGALGTAFTLLYAAAGVPLGRLTDRAKRTRILSAGVLAWSLLTAASGLARNFWQLFGARLGVGVGEATCAPAATSLIGDLVPASRRGKALSFFMLGLPVGLALSYGVSGTIAHAYGWRAAFYFAGVPGLLCSAAVLFIKEPPRGAVEARDVGRTRREGSPYLLVLSLPTMWWLILSGVLHNFNMYALSSFLTPLLMRFHHVDIRDSNFISMAIFGVAGTAGLLLGGSASDLMVERRANGRLLFGTVSLFGSIPLILLALGRPSEDVITFGALMLLACTLMYTYYSTVYPAILDIIEPSLRGTAMAIYFFGMYVLGASMGPLGTGMVSDFFTKRAARAAGIAELTQHSLEPFRAQGLHWAMYLVPVLGALLTLVLFAGSRTVVKDSEKLQRWMREASSADG